MSTQWLVKCVFFVDIYSYIQASVEEKLIWLKFFNTLNSKRKQKAKKKIYIKPVMAVIMLGLMGRKQQS